MSISEMGEFLNHYGVKGQRWGVRRRSRKTSSDFKNVQKHKGKRASELSDNQLKTINKRRELENKYNQMNPGKIAKGEAVTKTVLGTVGTGVAVYNLARSPAGQAAIKTGKAVVKASMKVGAGPRGPVVAF